VRRSYVPAAVRALNVVPLDTWLLFCVACVALVATPGPSIVYLVSRTLAQGRQAGLVSLCGTSSGFALHALAAAFGLSALLAAVPLAYEAVRWLGAAYLAWLAVATWRTRDAAVEGIAPAALPAAQLFRQGLLTAVLNPKVALFQLAFFPQFVTPANGSVLAQSLVLAATQVAIVVSGDSLFVFAAGSVRRWFSLRPGWGRWSRRALAGVFGALAARLVWQDRP
jgi:threonine/homoserine/homoserine lactone efflux protein